MGIRPLGIAFTEKQKREKAIKDVVRQTGNLENELEAIYNPHTKIVTVRHRRTDRILGEYK